MKTFIYAVTICNLIFSGCGGQKESGNNLLNISVKHTYIYSWLNLMPGSPSSFHITGNLRITNSGNAAVDNISLIEITISQNNFVIYKFSPEFETIHPEEDHSLRKNEVKEFRFNTNTRLSISPELKADKTIDAKLIFSSGGRTSEYMIKDIVIEKAY
jgi:hypothetical protein